MKRKQTIGQKKMLAATMPEASQFWEKELNNAIPSTYSTDFYRSNVKDYNANYFSKSIKVDSDIRKKLVDSFCVKDNELCELFASSVFALLYINYNGLAHDFLVNYNAKSYNQYLKVPLRMQIDENSTLLSLFNSVIDFRDRAQEHKNYPVDLLIPSQNIDVNVICSTEYEANNLDNDSILKFDFIEERDSGDFILTVTGDTSRYLKDSIKDIANKIYMLLDKCANSPKSKLLHINLFAQSDKEISNLLNLTDNSFSETASLVDLFNKTINAQANENAVISNEHNFTFSELDRMSKQIESFICEISDSEDSIVGILADRSIDFLIGVLGILRSGKAYLPLDPKAPVERNNLVLNQSGTKIVLCAEKYIDIVPNSIRGYALETINKSEFNYENATITPQSLAYIIFTSGSTGLPKGVCVNHKSVVNRIEWMQNSFPLCADDVILHKTPATFDVSVWELFWWLIAGCKVTLLPPNQEANPESIIEAIENNSVTTMHFVPSMLNAFLDYVESTGSISRIKSLRQVFCSGEALSPNHVQKFYALFDNVKLINLYGPTEATVDVSCHITKVDDNPVPIGRPIDNNRLYIVDSFHNQRPVGMVGELCIAGVGVSNGYINDASRTAERFLSMPSLNEDMVYMTGDLARLRHDQTIEYLGRNDRQVKVRGFRIELGEIEIALTNQGYINDAVVISNVESDGIAHLFSYVILADKTITSEKIMADLSKTLPKYMIPDKVIIVESMPLTANGKVDKTALLSLRDNRESNEKILPSSKEEKLMANIWESVLGIDEIGVTENFFALGGNSINFVSVLALANEKGLKFTFQQLFKNPTIRDLLKNSNEMESNEEMLHKVSNFELISDQDRSKIPDGIEDAYPMSLLQSGLVYQSIVMQGDNNYHDIVSYLIKGEINIDKFKEAVQSLVTSQPIFRTSYNLRDFSEYMQLVHKKLEQLPLNIHDIRGLKTQEEQDKWYEDWFWKEQHRPFEWETPGLVQLHIHILSDDLYRYSISQHNSALDGWSMNKVHTYLFQTYFDLINNSNEKTVKIGGNDHNRSFIHLEQQAIKSESHREFWSETLKNAPTGMIPRSRETKRSKGNEVVFHDVELPKGLSEKLINLANKLKVPVKDILLASHVKFLSLLTKEDDVFLGYEIGGRPEILGAEDALGVFLNTMPFRVILNKDETWGELICNVYDAEANVLPFRRYPMAKVKQDLGNMGILFETVFNFTHFYSLKNIRDLPGFDLIDVRAAAITEFPLRIEYSRHFYTDEVQLSLHYHTAEFDEGDMNIFGKTFIQILEAMVNHTDDQHNGTSMEKYLNEFTIYSNETETENTKESGLNKVEIKDKMEQPDFLEAVDRIKDIWSNVLGIQQSEINLTDDFFLIGGNSLSAMKVSLLMEKQLSLKTIMQKSVLYELALEIMDNNSNLIENTNLLQCLSKSTSSSLNVIFLPYAGGNALNFMPIAKEFAKTNKDVSVFAAELPGHDPSSKSSKLMDFSSLAKQITDEIEVKMGETDYVIWGHCVGTVLAFEVTRQLEERSRSPKKLYLASKIISNPNEILQTIENAKRLVFDDISKFHAEWTGTNELSTLGEEYELHLVKAFMHDSIESNKYLHSLWNKIDDITLSTPTVMVVTKDDPATITYAKDWSSWSNWITDLKLKEFNSGGHYFLRTIQSEVVDFLLSENYNQKSKHEQQNQELLIKK
ncbi:amino acid adenylation domain-containing protein [Peribacillus frigoritolerans]|uniref:non-ribosomal peptide synthetase n=1 Tax=Peribacillus frigoritolerans TaxID=450367 RepID=UPI002225ED77|nr:non-ribosomal peptide synthetase [Peribacillus frigoritolerans]UYY98651.1 amino acid adenylation domain-containing protein [Peribacillus frigoritolerans]